MTTHLPTSLCFLRFSSLKCLEKGRISEVCLGSKSSHRLDLRHKSWYTYSICLCVWNTYSHHMFPQCMQFIQYIQQTIKHKDFCAEIVCHDVCHEPPKPWKNTGFGHLKTSLFTIKASKNVGVGGPWWLM